MAYQANSEYNKFTAGCDCEDSSSCGCDNSACGCCPIGTIEVKDSCGKHVGCMLPSDAAEYYVDTLAVPEGYIKATNPNTGEYVGLLTPSEYCAYLTCVGGSGAVETFNINSPVNDSGSPLIVSIAGNASDTNVTGDKTLYVDRIGYTGDIEIEITSADGITFLSAATTITLPSVQSFLVNEFEHATGLAAGSYNATLTWTAGLIVKTQAITFVLS